MYGITVFAAVWMVFLIFDGWQILQAHFAAGALTAIALGGFLLSAFVIGVVYHAAAKRMAWIDRIMPTMAIVGILYVTAMTIAAGRDNLLKVGALLIVASGLHNMSGYVFGYYLSRLVGLKKTRRAASPSKWGFRTVAWRPDSRTPWANSPPSVWQPRYLFRG